MSKFEIKNRWAGNVIFECELSAEMAANPFGIQLGFAVRAAYKINADLRGTDLRNADLRGADLRGADLRDTDLRCTDLRNADLRGADLRDTDLRGADLRDTDLRGADLSDTFLSDTFLSGVPKIKNIHQMVYEAASQPGALNMSSWHCGTSHCRAGWVTQLAGEGGATMELCMGTAAAAALIYLKSDPAIGRIPNFYASNDEALADMKRLAEAEAAKS